MFEKSDAEDFRRRAEKERQKARETMDVGVAAVHQQLAEKYLARADELAPEALPGD